MTCIVSVRGLSQPGLPQPTPGTRCATVSALPVPGGLPLLKTRNCGELRAADAGADVTLAGWVHRRRDHGGLTFIDLRDSTGIVQVVVNPAAAPAAHEAATAMRPEYVVRFSGRVVHRQPGTVNDRIPTGEIEVQ